MSILLAAVLAVSCASPTAGVVLEVERVTNVDVAGSAVLVLERTGDKDKVLYHIPEGTACHIKNSDKSNNGSNDVQ